MQYTIISMNIHKISYHTYAHAHSQTVMYVGPAPVHHHNGRPDADPTLAQPTKHKWLIAHHPEGNVPLINCILKVIIE